MIDEIQVRDLALIRSVSLAPSRGLTVLTGETGAGKSALLSALKLLMGARADKDQVRDGASDLQVSGRFFGLHNSDDEVTDDEVADDETVVSRRVGADGRSRASIDGAMASVRELASLVVPSIDLCGQFEHQQLMRPATHVDLLDAWAGEAVLLARREYAEAFAKAREAAADLQRVRDARASSNAQLDEARFVLRSIDETAPREGEYEELAHELALAEHAESLARATTAVHEALAGDQGALDALDQAASALESAGSVDADLAALAVSLREAAYVLEDVAAEARDYRDKVDFDAESLAAQQERFAALQGLMRRFGPRMEDVLAKRKEAAEAVSLVDDAEARERAAARAVEDAESDLAAAARALDEARASAAPRFAAQVSATMARLEMAGSELVCSLVPLERAAWTPTGPSAMEFLYRPGAGMQARPLARIASGGEVSRVMLAVKVALGAQDDVDTLVFDEVDAGVGGAVAVALADVIADLAKTHQVIVVTHLAQVAVRGDAHYVVRRASTLDGLPETQLSLLSDDERVIEVARMLSGDATETSLAHAREMLSGAAR